MVFDWSAAGDVADDVVGAAQEDSKSKPKTLTQTIKRRDSCRNRCIGASHRHR